MNIFMEQKIKDVINILYERVSIKEEVYQGNSLVSGKLSLSLLNLTIGKALSDDNYINKGLLLFEDSYNEETIYNYISNDDYTFINGLSGFGWLYQYYVNEQTITPDEDFINFIDQIIYEYIIKNNNISYDLFYGLIGISNYYFIRYEETKNIKFLNLILNCILNKKTKDNIINSYYSTISENKNNDINLGFAHGLPSLLMFFLKYYEIEPSEIIRKECYEIANILLNFLDQDKYKKELLFPNNFNYIKKIKSSRRLAWCYGDLGIVYSLMYFNNIFKESQIYNQSLLTLNNINYLFLNSKLNVDDKCFCHGESGIMLLYYKLFHDLNYDSDSYLIWLEKLIDFNNINDFFTCKYEQNEKRYIEDLGIIEGHLGIIFSLCSLIDKNNKLKWTDIFML